MELALFSDDRGDPCERNDPCVWIVRDRLEFYIGRSIRKDRFFRKDRLCRLRRAFPFNRLCRFSKFEATETILTTETIIWKPAFRKLVITARLDGPVWT